MKIVKPAVCLALLWAAATHAHAQTEVCTLRSYFQDIETHISTSYDRVGSFPLELDNDEMVKLFRHEESGVAVSVGVEVFKVPAAKPELRKIRLKLSFTGKPGDAFYQLDGPEAEAIYDKHWKWLQVSDSVKVGGRIYTFSFGCEREDKKRTR